MLVQVVAIDEAGLKARGQWPWPRTLVADLVRMIAAGKPLVLGVDILFPEADRLSPPFTLAQDQLLPTFALEVIRTAAGIPSIAVTTGAGGIESVSLGDLSIPTDSRGRAYLHFGPPRPRYVSAATVLDPSFNPHQFE